MDGSIQAEPSIKCATCSRPQRALDTHVRFFGSGDSLPRRGDFRALHGSRARCGINGPQVGRFRPETEHSPRRSGPLCVASISK